VIAAARPNTSEAYIRERPGRLANHRGLPLAKQADVGEMHEDVQQRGVVEVRQPLVFPRRCRTEERRLSLLSRIQETKR
jgi:hypothetical protein